MKGTRTLLCSSIMGAAILSAGVLSGCNNRPAPVPPPKPPVNEPEVTPDVEHRISYSGETLAVIAAWYTGRAANWQAIRDANPGLRPERLNLGQIIMIPGDLVVQHEPMPKRFVTDNAAKARAKGTGEPKPSEGVPADIGSDPFDEGAIPGTQKAIEKVPAEIVKDAPDPLPAGPDLGTGAAEGAIPDVVKEAPKVDDVPPAGGQPTNVGAQPTKDAPPAMDSEREKLLDELLAQ